MSSAEDKASSTVLPPTGSSNSAPEEFSVDPHQEHGSENGSSSRLPEGSEKIELKTTGSPAGPPPEDAAIPLKTKPFARVNAVAREVRVKVTGAKAGIASEERDLFAESTTTVLVFEKGGVIRLAAAVTPGQLLFLSNEESKREVVTQVIRKRTYRPTECYVELEFTEPAQGFWGTEFSAATALLPKDANLIAAAELIASAETTDDELDEAAPPPSAEEVEALKKEVEALRRQLNVLQTLPEPVQSAQADSATVPKTTPALPDTQTAQVETPRYQTEKIPWTELSADAFPMEGEPKPIQPSQPSTPNQNLVPKPSMVFRKALPGRKGAFQARGQFTPGFRAGMLRLAILSSILAALIVAAWYKGWLPWIQGSKKIPVSSWAGGVTTPLPARRPLSAESQIGKANSENNSSVSVKASSPGSGLPTEAPVKSAGGNHKTIGSSLPTETIEKPLVIERSAPPVSTTKPSSVHSSSAKTVSSMPVSSSNANLLPPKLIKSERAIASLDDLRDFETGSVVIDAVIDTEGNVTSPRVLSGPPSLRWPALRAVKNYKYEPAMENGRPVASHVTVRIQFHFVE